MPRLSNLQQGDSFQPLIPKIQKIINSPLREVCTILENVVTSLQHAAKAGIGAFNPAAIAKDLDALIEHLPKTFSERFVFDTGMIQATVEELNRGAAKLGGILIPRPGKIWAHGTLLLPWEKGGVQRHVDFIFFRGGDDLTEINLLAYPFLIHEMGHNLLFRHDSTLTESFKEELDIITNRLRLSAIADTGAERAKSQKRIEELRKFWLPTSDHENWMHELAIDIIALWVCGPAYLAAFQDEMEEPDAKPYQITKDHPPNAVRAAALINVGDRLGWSEFTGGLNELVERWRQSQQTILNAEYNKYLTLADTAVVEACVSSALTTCEELSLPKCTTETIGQVREIITRGETPDFGVEVIIAAWLVWQEKGEEAFLPWQQHVVRDLLQYITL